MNIPDPEFGEGFDASSVTLPAQLLGPHVAPLGLEFVGEPGDDGIRQLLIAEHGSWNRSQKIGYRVTRVLVGPDGRALSYGPFISGWLQGDEFWGRPVDLELLSDGSLLLSDDHGNRIYRIQQTG